MSDDNQLPPELVWEKNGDGEEHLSEIVLATIADGQVSIVPEVAFTHLQWCEGCVRAIGESAMLSARVDSCLNEWAAEAVQHERAKVRVSLAPPLPVPWFAVAAALAAAALAAIPSLEGAPLWFHESCRVVIHALPALVHGVVTIAHGGASAPLAVSYASAALLMVMGIGIAMRNSANVRMEAQGR
ncbi:MAG TPA: hypothetical protein VNO21_08520 [Polyangiaceae bacterium]|nr:hypothetical protein [Polyangiaceae bacterium]